MKIVINYIQLILFLIMSVLFTVEIHLYFMFSILKIILKFYKIWSTISLSFQGNNLR